MNIKACLERHLVDKLKKPNVVPASAWLASAEQHHKSAQLIINHDAAGALQMAWAAMHDIAKAAAASASLRLEAETHGKIADFLACAFGGELEDTDLGLVHVEQLGDRRLGERSRLAESTEGGLPGADLVKDRVVARLGSGLGLQERRTAHRT